MSFNSVTLNNNSARGGHVSQLALVNGVPEGLGRGAGVDQTVDQLVVVANPMVLGLVRINGDSDQIDVLSRAGLTRKLDDDLAVLQHGLGDDNVASPHSAGCIERF